MRTKTFLQLGIAFLLMASCTSSQFVGLPNNTSKPGVEIFFQNQLPDGNYRVIGHIETSGWIFTSNKTLLNGMVKKAAKNDADAIIQVEFCKIPHILMAIPCAKGLAIQYMEESQHSWVASPN